MKKTTTWGLVLVLCLTVLAGCDFFGSDQEGGSGDPDGGDGGGQTLVEEGRPGGA